MNEPVCVDASVAVKWLLPERDSDRALQLLEDSVQAGMQLVGPPHLVVEVTSAVYKRFRLGELTADESRERLLEFAQIPLEAVFPPGITLLAFDLAAQFDWSLPYDAYYLAVGESLECEVWTADEEFYGDARDDYPRLRVLSDYGKP